MFGGFEQEFGMDGGREGGNDNSGDIFEREGLGSFIRFTSELPIFTRERARWGVDTDNMI